MIRLKQNSDCCGCEACAQRCPVRCISMKPDAEGFLYPQTDQSVCIDCGICEKICPLLNQGKSRVPLKVYAAKNKNEKIRMESSSGGVFTALAETVLDEGGVVFGAKFNEDWEVVHGYTETKEGLAVFRGSKYIQSRIGRNFEKAENFLKLGRNVLFTGTPCQIAGLKLFLHKEYENLLTVDFACHGVPSPRVWKEYLDSMTYGEDVFIENISFRNKCAGWKDFHFTLIYSFTCGNGRKSSISFSETFKRNVFMKGFLANLYLRPSCYACPSRCFKSGSDLTMADYWGIGRYAKTFDDDQGVSLVLVNSPVGAELYAKLKIENKETTYRQAVAGNVILERSVEIPRQRDEFWTSFSNQGIVAVEQIDRFMYSAPFSSMKTIVKRIIGRE